MDTFKSFAVPFEEQLSKIVGCHSLHAKWLNTLSYLENCGAKMIAASEHPTLVKEEVLKHAAEEFRHAHHLKRQIAKVSSEKMENYALEYILGGRATLYYLKNLNLMTCRYLKNFNLSKNDLKSAAYLLVTYAIELRAKELYPIYDRVLRKAKSKVMVKSILLEEEEHLKEMEEGLEDLPHGRVHAKHVCSLESNLCSLWLDVIDVLLQTR